MEDETYDDISVEPTRGPVKPISSINALRAAFDKKPDNVAVIAKQPIIPPRKNPSSAPAVPIREHTTTKKAFQPPTSPSGAPFQPIISQDILQKTKLNDVPDKRNSAMRGSKIQIPEAFQKKEENNNSTDKKPPLKNKPPVLKKPDVHTEQLDKLKRQLKPVSDRSVSKDTDKNGGPKNASSNVSAYSQNKIRQNEVNGDIPASKTVQIQSTSTASGEPKRVPPAVPVRKVSAPILPERSNETDKPTSKETESEHTNDSEAQTLKDRKFVRKLLPENDEFPPPKPARKPKFVNLPSPCHAFTSVHTRRLPSLPHDVKAGRQSERPVSLIPTMTDEELEEFEGSITDTQEEPAAAVSAIPEEEEEFYDDIEVETEAPAPRFGQKVFGITPAVSQRPEVTPPGSRRPPPEPHDEILEEEYDDIEHMTKDDSGSSDSSSLSPSLKHEDGSQDASNKALKGKDSDKKEKDVKKKEKALMDKYKRENKEQKKREKEEKEIRARFKMTGNEETIQTSIILESCKGNKMNLSVQQGEQVSILRLDGNPAGKFLAKNQDGKIGYIDANKVQVDTSAISSTMKSIKSQPAGSKFSLMNIFSKKPQVTLPSEEPEVVELGEDEEIYEEIDVN